MWLPDMSREIDASGVREVAEVCLLAATTWWAYNQPITNIHILARQIDARDGELIELFLDPSCWEFLQNNYRSYKNATAGQSYHLYATPAIAHCSV